MTKIEWTDHTINPVTGCTKTSPGCANCYAEKMTKRLKGMGHEKYQRGFDRVVMHLQELDKLKKFKARSTVFIGSMADIFHQEIPIGNLDLMFYNLRQYPDLIFQFLTKRPERLFLLQAFFQRKINPKCKCNEGFPTNTRLGVTVENGDYLDRIETLKQIEGITRFISFEPLLGPIPKIDLSGIHWVIVGGETGVGARPMNIDWARGLRDQCKAQGVPFFFKKVGKKIKTPPDLQIREFPK